MNLPTNEFVNQIAFSHLAAFCRRHDLALVRITPTGVQVSGHCTQRAVDGISYACSDMPQTVRTMQEAHVYLGY